MISLYLSEFIHYP